MRLKRPHCSQVLLLLTVSLATALPLRAQEPNVPRTRTFSGLVSPAFPYTQPEEVGLSHEKLDWIGDEIVSWVASGELVGAELLIIKNEKAVFHEAYGWSDRENGVPVRRNSIWSIKSMSKPFTATALLMLVDEGELSLDDPVSRYIPGFAGYEETTIGHLLSHSSGMGYFGDPRPEHKSLKQWVEDGASRPPGGTLGEFQYNDLGYGTAGHLVEVVTGMSIGEFTEERIIRPLGLADTSTEFSSDPVWRARLNPWYRWNERASAFDLRWATNRPGWYFYPAAWGMFSTAMDYAVFMAMWMNRGEWQGKRLLSRQVVNEALQPHARIGGSSAYGYGWYLDEIEGVAMKPFSHGGGDGTLAIAFPADDAIVIFLTHSRWGRHREAFWNRLGMSGLFEHYPGLGLSWEPMEWASDHQVTVVDLSPEEQARYVGTYRRHEVDTYIRVWEEGGRLNIGMGPSGAKTSNLFHLVPLGEDRFALGRYGESRVLAIDPHHEFRFRISDGVVNALEAVRDGKSLGSAERIE